MEAHQYKNIQIRVGFFLALGLLAAAVSIIALGGERALFTGYARLNARLPQVQGLNIGSVVSLSGIVVGNIEEIKFSNSDTDLIVVMKVDEDYLARIPKDSTVEIRTQGALGDKFVYMTPGDATKGLVTGGETLESAKSSDLLGILSEKGNEAAKVFDVISELHKLMKTINDDNRSEKIMKNLTEASTNFKVLSQETRSLVGELRSQNSGTIASSMKRLDSILFKLDSGQGSLGALINDPSLHTQLKGMIGGSGRKLYIESVLQNSIEKKPSK
ncbi:MAG: MlaD family protein [Bdellovibrio sp.]|jgi:phospholipid/cholesterol/gamma-HCH transport system substrate-binding protein